MNAIKILYAFIIILVLSGCGQKLPTYKEGYGMVAVPYHIINRTNFKFLHTYEWTSSTDQEFRVKIQKGTYNKDLALSKLIPSGNYTIDTMIIRQVQDTSVIGSFREIERKIEPPFDIYISPGSIMMVPVVFEFEQYLDADAILTRSNTHDIEDDEKEFYIDKLRNRENFSEWKIEML